MSQVLHLQTLGGLTVSANGGLVTGTLARRRSLALLALAAAEGDAGISDERAMALLWPDFDSARAKNNFKQVSFTLRQALGQDAFSRSTSTTRLDPSLFTVDCWQFEKALANNDGEGAASLYAGPFLAGFHIAGLPEFERWVETKREQLGLRYFDALKTLAVDAESADDLERAIALWRKVVAGDPLNESNAQRLIRALARSGDSAAALQHARVHESLLAQELDLTPGAAFQLLVQNIRAGTPLVELTRPAVRIATPPSAKPAIVLAMQTPVTGESTPAKEAPSQKPTATDRALRETRTQRIRRAWTTGERRIARFSTRLTTSAAVFVAVSSLAAFTVFRFGPNAIAHAVGAETSAVVAPFAGNGSGNVGAVVSELLAASLDGSMGLRVLTVSAADENTSGAVATGDTRRASARRAATKADAFYYIGGEVFESGERIRISAELRSRHDDAVLDRALVEGRREDLFDLVDGVASRLLAGRFAGSRRDFVRAASTTTASLPAAKAYFRGETALFGGNFRAAIDAFEEAVQVDPMFALAHYGIAIAAEMLGDEDLLRRSAAEALRYSYLLPSRQQRLLTAFVARQQGDVNRARRLYTQLTTDYPEDAEAWYGLAETLYHLNPLDGQPAADARDAFERVTRIDSTNVSAHLHLARIAAHGGSQLHARRLLDRARSHAEEPTLARYALHVLSLGVPDEAARSHGRGPSKARDLTSADVIALLTADNTDQLQQFANRLVAGGVRGHGLRLQSLIEVSHGRIASALALLEACTAANQALAVEARSRIAAFPFIPVDHDQLESIRNEVLAWDGESGVSRTTLDFPHVLAQPPYIRLHRLALISLRMGDTSAALAYTSQLDDLAGYAAADEPGRLLATSARAHLAAAQGHRKEALHLLEGMTGPHVTSPSSLEAFDRLLHAQLLEQAGRDEEALGWYGQLGARSPFELALVWQAELGMARIHLSRGNNAVAARYYRKVAARFQNADSTFQKVRTQAEEQVMALLPFDRSRWF